MILLLAWLSFDHGNFDSTKFLNRDALIWIKLELEMRADWLFLLGRPSRRDGVGEGIK